MTSTTTAQGFRFERGERGWFRFDLNSDYPEIRRFATGRDDTSPKYAHWEGLNYDAKCSCCWLGLSHTTDLHNARIS